MDSADPNDKSNQSEPVKAPESVWNDLEANVRERALRILSELCYAYVKAEDADCAPDDNSETPWKQN